MSREVQVKGQAFHGLLTALDHLRGRGSAEQARRALGGEAGEALRTGALVAVGWYPVAWYRDLHAAAQEVTSSGPSLARELGREATRHDLKTVHRLVLRMLSPETLLKQSNRVFHLYVDGGSVVVLESSKTAARVRYTQCFGCDRNVFEDILGSSEVMLEGCGATNARLSIVRGGLELSGDLEITARWD